MFAWTGQDVQLWRSRNNVESWQTRAYALYMYSVGTAGSSLYEVWCSSCAKITLPNAVTYNNYWNAMSRCHPISFILHVKYKTEYKPRRKKLLSPPIEVERRSVHKVDISEAYMRVVCVPFTHRHGCFFADTVYLTLYLLSSSWPYLHYTIN